MLGTMISTAMVPPENSGGTTPLVDALQAQIVEQIKNQGLEVGTRLVERSLAERLHVSRTPIRSALRALEETGVVERTGRGFVVARASSELYVEVPQPELESLYAAIAHDRLDGVLDEHITERSLLRRYGVTRGTLGQVLLRIANEGWIQPSPGYGWRFLPTLTSAESYEQSYRFRQLVEPAAIVQPGYKVNKDELLTCRQEQQELVSGRIYEVSGPELFDLNARLHETITAGCGNEFFIESLHRINRLRRLIEYRRTLQAERARTRCAEHVKLADLILNDDLEAASIYLSQHLRTVGVEKTADPADS